MSRQKKLFTLSLVLTGLFMLLGWQLLIMLDTLSPLPFGALPSILFAAMMTGKAALVLSLLIGFLLYAVTIVSLVFGAKGKRWALVTGTLCYCLDMAACLVFTAFSWWFLLGLGLDIFLIAMLWRMTFLAK